MSMYLYDLPMPVFRRINIDFCQDLNNYNKLRFKRFLIEENGSVPVMFDQNLEWIDQANDLDEEAVEIGPQWRKVRLQLLVKQIQEELYFLCKIATKRQIIDSIWLNFNNIDISDDDHAFYHVLKALKYFLTSISSNCKTVERLEIIFIRSHRNEKNEDYANEIKKFLVAIGSNESLKDSMKTIIFDSMASEIMVGLVSSFYNLETLKIIDWSYLQGEYFPLIKTDKLRQLNLSGSHQISYDKIFDLVVNNNETLRVLKIDGENIEGDQFSKIVKTIKVLEELCIYYANEAYSSLLHSLAKHSETLVKLVIRKNENFEAEDFEFLFDRKLPNLKSLVLDECSNLSSNSVEKIATKKYLKLLIL